MNVPIVAGDIVDDGGFNRPRFVRGSDPRVATCRGKLQNKRSKLNQEINKELRLRAGAENLFKATTNRKLKETVALELSFVNSNLQLLKEQLAELNSSVELYQNVDGVEPIMPMIPLGLKETKDIDFQDPFKAMVTEGQQEEYDEYKSTLDADTLEAARLELREDDNTREQALEQFRHWIQKHPAIKKCRTDSLFLLRFLRTKKFSLPMAQEMLERYLTIRQLYPDWFQKLDIDDPELEAIIDSGYLVPLPKRDRHGRKVILSCAGRFDPCKFSSIHMARVHSMVVETLMDDEENQIRGYTHLNDESGLTMSHLSAWSFTDIRNMLRCIQNSTPMRHKETHLINIPGSVAKIIEFAISLLNDKLKSRVMIHKDIQELREAVDPKILPKEYGGEIPLSEMIAEFKKDLKDKKDQLKALDDMYIEISPKDCHAANNEELGGICGSFRKLEVD